MLLSAKQTNTKPNSNTMNAEEVDNKIKIAKRKLKTVEGKIRRLDSKKAFMLERAYLETRHYLEQERFKLIEYIDW